MRSINKWWILYIGLLLVGIGMTIQDYRRWRYEETARFGQGSPAEAGVAPALALGTSVTSDYGRFRLRLPEGWLVKANPNFNQVTQLQVPLPTTRAEILRFNEPNGQAQIIVSLQAATGNVTELSDQEATGITRDRQYFSSDNANLTVLTWEREMEFQQKAYAVGNGELLVIDATTTASAWKTYVRTFEAVFQSLVWF